MSTDYGDKPTPRREMPTEPLRSPVRQITPSCRCGHNGKLFEEDNGFVVVCLNRYCPEPPVADDEACATPVGAWNLWWYKQTGVIR